MKVRSLIEYLNSFDEDDEIEIEVYETAAGEYVDSTASVSISDNDWSTVPTLRVDFEAAKFKRYL